MAVLIALCVVLIGSAILYRQGTIMAQLDDLNAALSDISAKVDTVAADVTALEQQLSALQSTTPPGVDLSSAIAQAQAISQKLSGIADAANPQPAPAPDEPTDQ